MALLAWLRSYRQASRAAQQNIGEISQKQKVIQRANQGRRHQRSGGSFEVSPFRRDQRLAAVRQNKNKLEAGGHAGLPQDFQRLTLEGVVGTRDDHAFGEVLMMGSVSYVPSTI
jgi:hypothetical protein